MWVYIWYIFSSLLCSVESTLHENLQHPKTPSPSIHHALLPQSQPKRYPSKCANTPTTREQWCEYNIYTDYTTTVPDTGIIREFWLSLDQATLSPDGRPRWALAINGSLPGPTIEVDWGDTVIIHLENNLPYDVQNGTSLHIHGLRQYYTNPMDGVVSVTQCPIAPGHTMTYRWRATQYGTTWYHSHIGLQTWEGAYGGVIINGPASKNYDEDKGVILLSDWDINTVDQMWDQAEAVGSPSLDNALINGVNVFGDDDQTGYRFNTSFAPGKSYRLRVTNVACDTLFKFSIDHHTMKVIAMDFVPIQPYTTTFINVAVGQRYDVVVQADQMHIANAFWLRATPQLSCSLNSNADNIRGIIYYETPDRTIKPNTTAYNLEDSCEDEPASKLIPIISNHLSLSASDFYYNETLPVSVSLNEDSVYRWFLNGTSMQGKWSQPTLLEFTHGESERESESVNKNRAILSIPKADTWVLVVIETSMPAPHPIHLHGHDFLVVAQGDGPWPAAGSEQGQSLELEFAAGALPKRDTALLPGLGHLVLAFRTDNPGAWLMHCHIGWHLDQGFALQFVERRMDIGLLGGEWLEGGRLTENCEIWDRYSGNEGWENGAGI